LSRKKGLTRKPAGPFFGYALAALRFTHFRQL
jgi:hypothetical protein